MQLRVARHTNNLQSLINFYTEVLNLELLGKFNNHDGYDGVFLGKKSETWHLEFTTSQEKANHKTDVDDLLVLYPENEMEYENILQKIKSNNIKCMTPKNPYWKQNGIQIQDPDGFNIIISRQKINRKN